MTYITNDDHFGKSINTNEQLREELSSMEEELIRLMKKNHSYKQVLKLVEDELEYAKLTGDCC